MQIFSRALKFLIKMSCSFVPSAEVPPNRTFESRVCGNLNIFGTWLYGNTYRIQWTWYMRLDGEIYHHFQNYNLFNASARFLFCIRTSFNFQYSLVFMQRTINKSTIWGYWMNILQESIPRYICIPGSMFRTKLANIRIGPPCINTYVILRHL